MVRFSPKLPGEIEVGEFAAPVGVVFRRIGVDRLVRSAVDDEIGLLVAAEVQLLYVDRAFDRVLEN